MARIVQSLRAAMPVDGVFLQLHGVMFAEGVGAGETLLVERLVPGTPRMAVVRIGGVHAILSEEVVSFREPDQFRACGIDPLAHKLVVVKQGYQYPKLTQIAPRHIMLLTPGAADMRIEKLSYTRRRKPLFPLEPNTAFEPDN